MDRLKLREGVQWREIEGEVVALDTEQAIYVATNAAGSLLWKRLVAGTTRDGLVETLESAFALDRSTAETDADKFLADVRAQGLLEA